MIEGARRLDFSGYGGCVLWTFGFKVWETPPGQTGGVYPFWALQLRRVGYGTSTVSTASSASSGKSSV